VDYLSTYPSPFTIEEILQIGAYNFSATAQAIFAFQYHNNPVYRKWVDALDKKAILVQPVFIPISFFKTHQLIVSDTVAEIIFTSSGTTGMQTSSHYVAKTDWYKKSFAAAFKLFYSEPADWAIIGLLPSYLERQGSSLVMMTEELIKASNNDDSGLYLYDFAKLQTVLKRREAAGQKTWLIGVTYALLDFAAQCPMPLVHTTILETGGMKGRKKEMTRMEVQQELKQAFELPAIHSEYGMTELLSQAYSSGNGLFTCPPWMKVLVREEDDPLQIKTSGTGALCIIDLANMYSCSFIATEDLGKVYADGSFEILGRMDNSDIRGCSLLTL
jgi:Acyl-protein synthetase, LuxE